jgi:hypothetical protein
MLLCSIGLFVKNTIAAEPEAANMPLRNKYMALQKSLLNNQFQRPLYLNSVATSNNLKGEIYAVVDYPFATVNTALNDPEHWCNVLILHINIKYCHAATNKNGAILTVNLGNKTYQALADTYQVEFNYKSVITTPDYFALELNADNGPIGTHDYKIMVEATPLASGRTFLHFTYAYAFGIAGRLAMQAYLVTFGRDKVGFTIIGKLPDGQPSYVQGLSGVVERNTMRYYLAIDAYLAAMSLPAKDQFPHRLQQWYNSIELYPLQLHDLELAEYLDMKGKEYLRQQAP